MRARSLLITALALSLAAVSSLPGAHAQNKKKKEKEKEKEEAKTTATAKPATSAKPTTSAKPVESAKPADKKPDDKAKPPPSATPPADPKKTPDPKPAAVPAPAPEPEPAPPPASFDIEELRKTRADRRKQSVARSRQLWGALLASEKGAAELKRHSFLIATLQRIRAIAESKKDTQSVETANALLAKEEERHVKAMTALRQGAGQ